MNIYIKSIVFLFLALAGFVIGMEEFNPEEFLPSGDQESYSSEGEESLYRGILFDAIPSQEQTVQLSLIKRIVLSNEEIPELQQEYLPDYIKGIATVAQLLKCLSELDKFEELNDIQEGNILGVAFNEKYIHGLIFDIKIYKQNSINCEDEQAGQEAHENAQLYAQELSYLECVKNNINRIVHDTGLSYLFIAALNDPSIAILFENDHKLIKDMFHSFIDILLLKGEKITINNLLLKNELMELLIDYLITINYSASYYFDILEKYESIMTDQFLPSIKDILNKFFNEVPEERLVANNSYLADFLMNQLLLKIPFLNDENTQLLNSLFERGITPNIMNVAEPYVYWLFYENLFDASRDEFKHKVDKIRYLIENGLDYPLLELPISSEDSPVAVRAKNNYLQLKQSHPNIIESFEKARRDYVQKGIREIRRLGNE